MSAAWMCLGLAVLIGAGPSRLRPPRAATSGGTGAVTTGAGPLVVAANLEVFAVCLRAGMPVSAAAAATASGAPPRLAGVLQRAADLLALGADPAVAWSPPPDAADPQIDALLRLARRSAQSGTALIDGVVELAAQCREEATHTATAAAERAGVLIAGPLGLCFLPAFVVVGILPTVAGLAGDVLHAGLVS